MPNIPERGNKYSCTSCATLFYDLNKKPAICPKCGQKVSMTVKAPVRRTRRTADDSALNETNSLSHPVTVIATKEKFKHVKWK